MHNLPALLLELLLSLLFARSALSLPILRDHHSSLDPAHYYNHDSSSSSSPDNSAYNIVGPRLTSSPPLPLLFPPPAAPRTVTVQLLSEVDGHDERDPRHRRHRYLDVAPAVPPQRGGERGGNEIQTEAENGWRPGRRIVLDGGSSSSRSWEEEELEKANRLGTGLQIAEPAVAEEEAEEGRGKGGAVSTEQAVVREDLQQQPPQQQHTEFELRR